MEPVYGPSLEIVMRMFQVVAVLVIIVGGVRFVLGERR